MIDKFVYETLHIIMKWTGALNSWAWRKHTKIIRDNRERENEEYLKELKKKLLNSYGRPSLQPVGLCTKLGLTYRRM